MKYRTRPLEIEAIRACDAIDDARDNWAALPAWLVEAYNQGGVVFTHECVWVPTPDGGTRKVNRDEWIVRGVSGEMYGCKPDIFSATYEAVP